MYHESNIHCTVYSYFSNNVIYKRYENEDLYNTGLRPYILRPLKLLVSVLKVLHKLNLISKIKTLVCTAMQSNLKLFHLTKSYREQDKSSQLSVTGNHDGFSFRTTYQIPNFWVRV